MNSLKKMYNTAVCYFKQILTEVILPLRNPNGLERLTLQKARIPVRRYPFEVYARKDLFKGE